MELDTHAENFLVKRAGLFQIVRENAHMGYLLHLDHCPVAPPPPTLFWLPAVAIRAADGLVPNSPRITEAA